jgi:galactokinase
MPSRQPDPSRIERIAAALARVYPEPASAPVAKPSGRTGMELVRAPGRVNLIGDHTDYNDGFVMSVAIELDCWLAFRRRSDGLVRLASCLSESTASFWIDDVEPPRLTDPDPRRPTGWTDYAAGVAWSLRESGMPLKGIDGIVDSTVPSGIGLGSSAALELACALALAGTDRVVASPVLAALAQRAEREYVGVDNGIKDQLASAAGRQDKSLLLDCRTLDTKLVAMPYGLRVVVCDTGTRVRADHTTFAERRAECGRAVALLSERMPGLCSLRDLDAASLKRHRARLPERVARRAEHVVGENGRVLDAAVALASSDLGEVARLFAESHASLRDLFEVGSPQVEAMMGIAGSTPGVVASRMSGPGLGGCTIHLVLDDAIPAFTAAVQDRYRSLTGLDAHVYPLATVDGAGRLSGLL